MYFTKRLKILSIIFLTIIFDVKDLIAIENKILFKVDNEIITTIDIYEEVRFLKTFNPEMENLSEKELFEISKNSLLRDRIKKVEIMNFVKELKVDDKFLSKLIVSKYSKIGIDSLEKFEIILKDKNLDVKLIKEKFFY